MTSQWSNEDIFKFIELYQNNSVIWNPKHKCHKDRNKLNDAWDRIADEMGVPVPELKKKKETLMAAFRMNHKRVVASQKWGAEEEVFKPSWIYYDSMAAFLTNVYESKQIVVKEDLTKNETNSISSIEDADETHDILSSPPIQDFSQVFIPVQKRRSHKTHTEQADTSTQIESALSKLDNVLNKMNTDLKTDEDDCDMYGKLLAKALRQFNEADRLELRHEIDGLLIKKKRSLSSQP